MMSEMPAAMFSEWLAYYQMEPFGTLADDMIAAHGKAIYVNSNRRHGKRAQKVEKFLTFSEKKQDAARLFEAEEE